MRSGIRSCAFVFTELLILVVLILMVLALLVPALRHNKERAAQDRCRLNLMQIGLAFKIWGLDNSNKFPTHVSKTFGGSQEYAGQAFRHFQVLSNDLTAPFLLLCPSDTRGAAKNFSQALSNSNVSYAVSLDASSAQPIMLLAGDRNITNGVPLQNGILTLTSNRPAGWTHEMHKRSGQWLMVDGSVQRGGLNQNVFLSGTNRLAVP